MQHPIKNATFEVSLKFVIKNKKGEVLLLEMPDNDQMAGFYDLPGGRIKENERKKPFGEIIERELREEIGERAVIDLNSIPVAIGRHDYISKEDNQEKQILWVFFEGIFKAGEIIVSSEHTGYTWVFLTKENLAEYFVKGPLEGMYHYLYREFP